MHMMTTHYSLQTTHLRTHLHLYNSLKKCEEEFIPQKKGVVSMYTCGPTVYSRPHIGNYASFLMADVLRRWLEVLGYEVQHVKNITDVGHLVADADEGEDKIERQAKAEKLDPLAIARRYADQYIADEQALNLLEPMVRPRATETIPEMIAIISLLLEKGFAYETQDGVYFSVEKFPQYGALSGNTLAALDAGSRIAVNEEKQHPADFALWKKIVGANTGHILQWDSPFGRGFPGWHIECSAMSTKFLGTTIDIHTGGEDNIFPHHECEIAQSEAANSVAFVRYWLHRRRIEIVAKEEKTGVATEKMSKSLGNVLSLPDIIEHGYDPMDLRFLLLSVHYRTRLKFSWKGMEDAKKARTKILDWITEFGGKDFSFALQNTQSVNVQIYIDAFSTAMNADLNVSDALASIFNCMAWSRTTKLSNDDQASLRKFFAIISHTFGCFDNKVSEVIPSQVLALIEEREQARKSKNFAVADTARAKITALGYTIEDTPKGPRAKKL